MVKPVMKDIMEPEKESVPEPVEVVSVTHYSSWKTMPEHELTDSVTAGEIVYTEIVFSANVPLVVANDNTASPDIRAMVDGSEIRFNIVPHGSAGENFQSGDCKPLKGTNIFLCKYGLSEDASGTYTVTAMTKNSVQSVSLSVMPIPPMLSLPPEEEATSEVSEDPITEEPPVDYYAIVDAGLETVNEKLTALVNQQGHVAFFSIYILISEEFNIVYTLDMSIEAAVAYREANGIEPNGDIPIELRREHIKLLLEFPEKTNEEIIEHLITIR